jgi:hypothetical protein
VSAEPRLVETDALVVTDAASRKAHQYAAAGEGTPTTVRSAFEGRESGNEVSFDVTEHTGVARFEMHAIRDNLGCRIRRVFDQKNGRQSARITVDGDAVGVWYTAEENGALRFSERDYFVPSRYTRGKETVVIGVEPTPAAPLWSVAEYRLVCVTAP